MSEMEKLADAIDPRVRKLGIRFPSKQAVATDADLLIAASDALRQRATALEIGRGIGREEAAKVVDEAAERCLANAEHQRQHGDRKVAEQWGMKASLLFDRASAIRAASQALDVEALFARCIDPALSAYNGAPDSHSQNVANVVRIVLASLIGGEK